MYNNHDEHYDEHIPKVGASKPKSSAIKLPNKLSSLHQFVIDGFNGIAREGKEGGEGRDRI